MLDILPSFYFFLHQRLCKVWIINFIMTMFSLPNYIDYNIFFESVSLINGSFESVLDFNRLLSVDMNNRAVSRPAQISRLQPMSVICWVGGEPNLIVDHDMDGSSG